jgi:putative PIG3 family NAD(P)H quinone oxidoreductase
MKAIEISTFGGPEVLKIAERPKPVPAAGEIVIRVLAAGVARADVMQRQGKYPPPPGASDIPGLDAAGIVDSCGTDVGEFQPGDQVCAILSGGGYAEFCAVPTLQVLRIPENWSIVEAATLPENIFTVYDNVITRGQLARGETVLIHGGSSGIGVTAIMLSKVWDATVITTAGTDDKCAACRSIGADFAINYRSSDFARRVAEITSGRGVDLILDLVGGPYLERNLDSLAIEGRIVVVSVQGGRSGTLDLGKLMHKRARIGGSTMRARTPEQKGSVRDRLAQDVWPLLPAKNPIRPIIDSTFPLSEASRAHQRIEEGTHIGRIILTANATV